MRLRNRSRKRTGCIIHRSIFYYKQAESIIRLRLFRNNKDYARSDTRIKNALYRTMKFAGVAAKG